MALILHPSWQRTHDGEGQLWDTGGILAQDDRGEGSLFPPFPKGRERMGHPGD